MSRHKEEIKKEKIDAAKQRYMDELYKILYEDTEESSKPFVWTDELVKEHIKDFEAWKSGRMFIFTRQAGTWDKIYNEFLKHKKEKKQFPYFTPANQPDTDEYSSIKAGAGTANDVLNSEGECYFDKDKLNKRLSELASEGKDWELKVSPIKTQSHPFKHIFYANRDLVTESFSKISVAIETAFNNESEKGDWYVVSRFDDNHIQDVKRMSDSQRFKVGDTIKYDCRFCSMEDDYHIGRICGFKTHNDELIVRIEMCDDKSIKEKTIYEITHIPFEENEQGQRARDLSSKRNWLSLSNGKEIQEVIRISDNEVFKIGDVVEYRSYGLKNWEGTSYYGNITRFNINNDELTVSIEDVGSRYPVLKFIDNIRHYNPYNPNKIKP